MNLKERYKYRGKRRIIRFFAFYLFFAILLLLLTSTFSRYATIQEGQPKAYIANWDVKINNEDITNQTTLSNVITLVPDSMKATTTDNKLAPGKYGYFDLIINPEGTEVAVKYTVSLDTTNLPEGIVLTYYEILEDKIFQSFTNTSIVGEINLSNNEQALSENDKKTVRVYWEWKEDTTNIPTETENYDISVTINVSQKLSN